MPLARAAHRGARTLPRTHRAAQSHSRIQLDFRNTPVHTHAHTLAHQLAKPLHTNPHAHTLRLAHVPSLTSLLCVCLCASHTRHPTTAVTTEHCSITLRLPAALHTTQTSHEQLHMMHQPPTCAPCRRHSARAPHCTAAQAAPAAALARPRTRLRQARQLRAGWRQLRGKPACHHQAPRSQQAAAGGMRATPTANTPHPQTTKCSAAHSVLHQGQNALVWRSGCCTPHDACCCSAHVQQGRVSAAGT
jgi:hypothetical protein